MAKTKTRPTPMMISARGVQLSGDLVLPPRARGLVLFAHGSGSSRLSPRNRAVAEVLDQRGLGTLLIDLLTPSEETVDAATGELRFDIPFLAGRLEAVSDWLRGRVETRRLALGYFGASTGAAAALVAAAARPGEVFAVVSRGGRPDLAVEVLARVRAPTLLIVGGEDREVLAMNEVAASLMKAEHRLEIVPGATHLFEEPGALEEVSRLAADWFLDHLPAESLRH
ncbi:MAG: dienelactone hydrolase family protein [Elusimicrobia bacterium]|nr:dienelactone hydrolase family protein [Elusimicrobiota bacterium]